jgi:hypothetical protein
MICIKTPTYSAYKQKEQRRRTQSYRATTPEMEKNTKALYKVNPIAIKQHPQLGKDPVLQRRAQNI